MSSAKDASHKDINRLVAWSLSLFFLPIIVVAPISVVAFFFGAVFWIPPMLALLCAIYLGFRCEVRLAWWGVLLVGTLLPTATYLFAAYFFVLEPANTTRPSSFSANGTDFIVDGDLTADGIRTYYLQFPILIASVAAIATSIAWIRTFGFAPRIRLLEAVNS